MASVFISRIINDQDWLKEINNKGHHVECRSLLEIKKVTFAKPDSDWVFFYSQNGVHHFFEESQAMLAPYKWACMGPKTAETLSNYVLEIDFIGNGDPVSTAKYFDKVISNHEVVCYCRASRSMKSVQSASLHPNIIDLIVYENEVSDDVPNLKFDILAFTSPLNVEAYYSKHDYNKELLIAIGSTTAEAILNTCKVEPIISEQPSEEGILSVISKLIEYPE